MKMRYGHVSNSSSSSFVCCICGRKAEGHGLTIGEAEMVSLETVEDFYGNVCDSHLPDEMTVTLNKRQLIGLIEDVLDYEDGDDEIAVKILEEARKNES